MSLVFFLMKSVMCMSWTWIMVFNSLHQIMAQQVKALKLPINWVPLGFILEFSDPQF